MAFERRMAGWHIIHAVVVEFVKVVLSSCRLVPRASLSRVLQHDKDVPLICDVSLITSPNRVA